MSYFARRRAEILGGRSRRKRRCDVRREEQRRVQAPMALLAQRRAAMRLWMVWA